jgi:hypothetical protein
LLPAVLADCKGPLDELVGRLERRAPDDALGPGGVPLLRRDLARLEHLTDLFGLVLQQRTKVTFADTLDALDQAAQDCLVPYLVHARRLDVPFTAARALVVVDPAGAEHAPPLETPDLAIAVVDESALERPAAWSEIAAQVALAWIRGVPRLASQLVAHLGLHEARSSAAQFSATGRLTIAALTALWLQRLAADAMATIQLGPAFAAGLERSLKGLGDIEQALSTRLGQGFRLGPPPLHLRMYVACVTMDRLGLEDEAARRWERWKKQVGDPEALVLTSDRFPPLTVPLDRTYGYVAGVIEAVISQPMVPLGGYPLGQIPGLSYDGAEAQKVERAAARLAGGEPVGEAPRTVLAAAALAVESSAQFESRVRKATLASLGGELEDLPYGARPRLVAGPHARDLRSLLAAPGFLPRAIAISAAFAPTRGGRRPK